MVVVQLKKDVFNWRRSLGRRLLVLAPRARPGPTIARTQALSALKGQKVFLLIIQSMFEKNFYCISSRIENSGQLYGCFKIGPFHRHQSLTFANALRRTLLADRSRCTLNAIQINDVEHEFSSLTGVRESVVDILLNLEKLIFQIKKPITKPQVAFIHFCGPGILRAQHIYLPSNFKCVIPSQYIATLEVDGKLTLKLFFSPNWNQFQFFIQNLIRLKPSFEKVGSRFSTDRPRFRPPTARGYDFRGRSPIGLRPNGASPNSNAKKLGLRFRPLGGKYLKNLFKYRYILYEKIYPKATWSSRRRVQRSASGPRSADPKSLMKILNNRLKIVHYLTNNLFRNNHRYLQLLSIPFQFLNLKIPISVLATKARPDLSCASLAKQGSFVIYDQKKSVRQYKKQRMKTHYKKDFPQWRLWQKNRKTSSLDSKVQENFLFLNHSLCAIETVNYALQSTIGRSPSLEAGSVSRTPEREDTTFRGSGRTTPKQDILFADTDQQTGSAPRTAAKKINNLTDNIHLASTKNRSFHLKCHLKLNSHSNIQRKLLVCSSPDFVRSADLFRGGTPIYSKKAQTTQNLFQTTPSRTFDAQTSLAPGPLLGPRSGQGAQTKRFKTQAKKNSRSFYRKPGSGLHEPEFSNRKNLISKNEEFILFEVWTDGSILPQTAILRALNELLLEMFPYSLQISKYEKIHQISNNPSKDSLNPIGPGRARTDFAKGSFGSAEADWAERTLPGGLSFFLYDRAPNGAFGERTKFPDLSKKSFRERFLNLEIGNFYFDLETYIFLKKRKIHRIMDFFQYLNQKEMTTLKKTGPKAKPGIQMTLDQFQIFLHSFI